MLKNLFNNPWFVASMGIFATIYLGYTLIKPIFFDGAQGVASDDIVPPFEEVLDEFDQQVSGLQRNSRDAAADKREKIGWLESVNRDPFASTRIDEDAQTTQLPRVGALFVSDGVQAAVVNNRLVRVGDKVADFQVTEIGLAHVQLQRYGKFYRLEPEV